MKKYIFREFDFGAWLRALKSPAARKKYHVEETLRGILVPARVASKKFQEIILTTPQSKGIFFNGNPKKLSEAKTVAKAFADAKRSDPLVIYLTIPKQEIKARLLLRRRSDDAEEYFKNRIKYYNDDIRPMVNYFKTRYKVVTISGLGTENEVFQRMTKAIEDYRRIMSKGQG